MKKILHIQVLPKLSGVQKISYEIFKGLPDTCYDKWVLFSDELDAGDKTECIKAFESTGAHVLFSPYLKRQMGWHDLYALKEIYILCKREKFDIVHTHSTKPGIIGRIAATFAHVPLVIHTVHGLAFHKFIKFPRWQFYWACEIFASIFCNRIILVNHFYDKYFKWFAKKTTTIYNGIDFTQFPKIPKVQHATPIVLFVGRLDIPKDPITILKAAKICMERYPLIRFRLVGDGELFGICEDYIIKNKLQNNVELLGWRNNVAKYYADSDIFVAPSIYESFGLMFLEAGYYRLPIVSTIVEGIPEVVKHNITGLLSNPRDYEAVARNIIQLVENSNVAAEFGENGFKRVLDLFTADQMVANYRKEYERD